MCLRMHKFPGPGKKKYKMSTENARVSGMLESLELDCLFTRNDLDTL